MHKETVSTNAMLNVVKFSNHFNTYEFEDEFLVDLAKYFDNPADNKVQEEPSPKLTRTRKRENHAIVFANSIADNKFTYNISNRGTITSIEFIFVDPLSGQAWISDRVDLLSARLSGLKLEHFNFCVDSSRYHAKVNVPVDKHLGNSEWVVWKKATYSQIDDKLQLRGNMRSVCW